MLSLLKGHFGVNAMNPSTPAAGPVKGVEHISPSVVPEVKSLNDLVLIKFWDSKANAIVTTFLLITDDDEVFFGRASKDPEQMTLEEYTKALKHVPDSQIFPERPAEEPLTIAPDEQEGAIFVKRPGLYRYQPGLNMGTPQLVLSETLIMEALLRNPHPNIVRYHGCRVRRGRITAILLDEHEQTLSQLAETPEFSGFDRAEVYEAVNSAVEHLHSMGLAHNDINPDNIMFHNKSPILIDFGSCQPFGKLLQSFGTPGWYKEAFRTSEKCHDTFSLGKLREWLKLDPQD